MTKPLGGVKAEILGALVGGIAATVFDNGNLNKETFVESVIESTISLGTSKYFHEIYQVTKDGDFLNELMPTITEGTGLSIKYFFKGTVTATMAMEER